MKNVFILFAVTAVSTVSADQYSQSYGNNGYSSCPTCNKRPRYYQEQSNRESYYQQGGQATQPQNPPPNSVVDKRDDQSPSQSASGKNPSVYSEEQLQASEKKFSLDFAANPSDRQLNAKIRDKVNGGWFSKGYETLVLKTTNGVVIVSGNVDKVEDVQKVPEQIQEVDGVKSVVNQLVVKVQ